jgi:putative glutamine amidotransferase
MKKRFCFQFLLFSFLSISSWSQNPGLSDDRNTLLIMNPTVNHLSGVVSLINDKIFPLKGFKLKGVYFAKEAYDYSETEQYIKDNNLDIALQKVDENLFTDKLFCNNACTPVFEKLFNESSGVIFYGGPDIPPAIYGEKTNTLTSISDPYRHYFEASFLFHLLGGFQDMNFIPLLDKNPDYLVVGYCLGMQTMNVAAGGTLIQDIPLEVYNMQNVEDILMLSSDKQHRNYETNIEDSLDLFRGNIHPIKIVKGSWLEKEGLVKPGETPVVVSSHHKAAEKTGRNLKVVANSLDGKIIEAVSHNNYPNVFGFQFHPEVPDIYNYDNTYQLHSAGVHNSLRKTIEKGNGYEFHIALWKKFAEVLNQSTKTL